MMDEILARIVEKGIIKLGANLSLEEAKRRWLAITELQYTRPITREPDVWIAFLRINRGN